MRPTTLTQQLRPLRQRLATRLRVILRVQLTTSQERPLQRLKVRPPRRMGSIDDEDRWIIPQGKPTGYRVNNASATPPHGGSTSSWKTANTYHSGYVIQASDLSDSSEDEPCVSWMHPALSAHTVQFPRKKDLRPQQVVKPTTGREDWTLVEKINPQADHTYSDGVYTTYSTTPGSPGGTFRRGGRDRGWDL